MGGLISVSFKLVNFTAQYVPSCNVLEHQCSRMLLSTHSAQLPPLSQINTELIKEMLSNNSCRHRGSVLLGWSPGAVGSGRREHSGLLSLQPTWWPWASLCPSAGLILFVNNSRSVTVLWPVTLLPTTASCTPPTAEVWWARAAFPACPESPWTAGSP